MDKSLKFSSHCLQRYHHDAISSMIHSLQKSKTYCQIMNIESNVFSKFLLNMSPVRKNLSYVSNLILLGQAYVFSSFM